MLDIIVDRTSDLNIKEVTFVTDEKAVKLKLHKNLNLSPFILCLGDEMYERRFVNGCFLIYDHLNKNIIISDSVSKLIIKYDSSIKKFFIKMVHQLKR